MTPLKNDRLLRALRREPVDRTPVWLMRQAGRYLPEYRATRAKAGSFMQLCTSPDLACEVTLQPLERYDLDAAILFSDILTIPDAMGLGLSFAEGEGPRFAHPVRSAAEIAKLAPPDPEGELRYVTDAVRTIAAALDARVPLIGFSGSPWTLACYMVEGQGKTDFSRVKGLMFDDPAAMRQLLGILSTAVTEYLRAQIAAGAQAVMVFDTWGGLLSEHDYRHFSLAPMQAIVEGLREGDSAGTPITLFSKGVTPLEAIADTGCDGVGLDWTTSLGAARQRIGDRVCLQGNLDPMALYASPERIRAEVQRTLDSFGPHPGHVFNLGHGLRPDMDPEHVGACVDAVHALSTEIHAGG